MLPALSALETKKSGRPSPAVKMRWIKQNTTIGAWYRALSIAMAHVIVDTTKVLVEQSFTLEKKVREIELLLPAVRKILRGRPTFPYNDWRMNTHGLAELVPLRITTRDLWMPEMNVSAFVGVGAGSQIIQAENQHTDRLAVGAAEEERMKDQAEATHLRVREQDRELKEQTTAYYDSKLSRSAFKRKY